jgi:NAD(P)-dependent dehydrogenase (short-subunit alcohol dehydrogenase family)
LQITPLKYVLITGITTGIGFYIAKLILGQGYQVIGSYRSLHNIPGELTHHDHIHLVRMDLADEHSIEEAFIKIKEITAQYGLYAIINNAGIAIPGPITHLPLEKIKYQFQINLFGHIKVIQLAFGLLKTYGPGSRIINMSSVSGLFASPFLGAYASSKFAFEGLSDSLRRELRLMGIKVVIIEPGPVRTPIWKKNMQVAEDFKESPYAAYLMKAGEIISETSRNALPPERLRSPVLNALSKDDPKPRYLIHKNKILFYILAKILPVPLADFLVQRNLKSGNRKIRPI